MTRALHWFRDLRLSDYRQEYDALICTPGARAARAIRSSMRACASFGRPAGCTIGCAWVPELAGVPDAQLHALWEAGLFASDYPPPVVDHAERREEALHRYRDARERAGR